MTASAPAIGLAGHEDQRQALADEVLQDVVADGPAEDDEAVDARGEVEQPLAGRLTAVRREDEDAAAQVAGHVLVAEHDLGEVRPGQVGEDDAVRGVLSLGERRADRLGVKRRSSTAARTRSRVPADTGSVPRRTRETVAIETPACRATS